ncbi:MAG: signal peptidase II [Eubacterium sp.]|jgi:signal peptidase II|nr:signal peptidase II [Eubacterium sp.]NBI87516.1 signal peptidase II [Lachnospiraceae bacterium]
MGLDRKKAFLALPAVVFGADWTLKRYIEKNMETGEEKEVCGGRLIIRKHYNDGAAFGLFGAYPKAVAAVHGGLLAAAAACYAVLLREEGKNSIKIATGLLLGGGFCNFWDRLTKQHVVDYMSFNVKCSRLRKVVFNLSDLFVFAGAVMNLFFVNLAKKRKKE